MSPFEQESTLPSFQASNFRCYVNFREGKSTTCSSNQRLANHRIPPSCRSRRSMWKPWKRCRFRRWQVWCGADGAKNPKDARRMMEKTLLSRWFETFLLYSSALFWSFYMLCFLLSAYRHKGLIYGWISKLFPEHLFGSSASSSIVETKLIFSNVLEVIFHHTFVPELNVWYI